MARIKALWLLGTAFALTVLRLLFRRRSGLQQFIRNYGPDRLPALTAQERQELPAFSRCIACGRCDEGEAARVVASAGEYRGIMSVVLAASRSTTDYLAAERSLTHVDDAVLQRKERLCPTQVPIASLADFVRRKAAQVRQESPGSSSG